MTKDLISFPQNLLNLFPEIDRIEDRSDFIMKRARIFFKCNKIEISIVYGFGSFGYFNNLLEVGIFDETGRFTDKFYEDNLKSSGPLGYCTKQDVIKIIHRICDYKDLLTIKGKQIGLQKS